MKTLLAAASALVLSAVAANAAPAVTASPVNLRNGPGIQYAVITTLPGGATVDVGGCDAGWCAVNFNGTGGYVSAGFLQMAGAPPAVAVAPTYVAPDVYADDYYDYGPTYYGVYGGPRFGFRGHIDRGHDFRRGPVAAAPVAPRFNGPARTFSAAPGPRIAAPARNFNAGPRMGSPGPRVSAPVSMPRSGPAQGRRGS